MRWFAVLVLVIAICAPASAEIWVALPEYVDQCSRIVKVRTVVEANGELTFRVIESWKGSLSPEQFEARQGEHGVDVVDGQEIVFFFTDAERHSTAFPIKDGKLTYASTGMEPQEFTVAAFKRAILQHSSPPGLYPFVVSPCGNYRLRIVNQERRVEEGRPDRVGLQFDLEVIDPADPTKGLRWNPTELFFEMKDPLVLARTAAGKDIAAAQHFPSWGLHTGMLAIHSFEVPRGIERLAKLAIECELIHVTESDELVFEKLGSGESDLLHCGAFELSVMGAPEQVTVGCAAYAIYEADHRAFQQRVPIRALHHRWAIAALELTDAEGKKLMEQGGGGSGGASSADFVREDGAAVAYPVVLRLRMPKKFRREPLRFEFHDLRLARLWPAGGTELVYRIGTEKRSEILAVIQKRLEGIEHFELQLAGDDRCALRIQTLDPMRLTKVKALLESPGKLEFRITIEPGDPSHEHYWKRFQGHGERTDEGVRWYPVQGDLVQAVRTKTDTNGKRWMLVALDDHDITGADFEEIECRRTGLGRSWAICFTIVESRREAMSRLTSEPGRFMAVILNGAVISAPVLNCQLSDRVQIDANHSEEQTRVLAAIFRGGALDVRPVLLSERPTGPDR